MTVASASARAPRSPATPAGDSARPGRPFRSTLLIGVCASVAVVIGATMGGSAFVRHTPGAWFFGEPGGHLGSIGANGQPTGASLVLVYGGILVLLACWVRLVRLLRARPGTPVSQVVKVIAAWAAPVVVGPPLFSVDVYSYAGQAELVSRHINPYSYGTGILGGTPFNTMPGPVWSRTPSPYGPLILRLDGLMATVSHHGILLTLVLLRLIAVVALAVAIAALVALARDHGRDPAPIVALAAASPLAVLTIVGGAHNDVVMAAMVLVGLVVARRRSWLLGIVICAAAVTVKVPALLAVGFLGWNWAGPGADWRQRLRRTVLAGAIGALTIVVVSEATGLGMSWVHTLNAAAEVSTGVTPVATVAHVFALLPAAVGIHAYPSLLSVFRVLGLMAAGAFAVWQMFRSPRTGMLRALGASLLAVGLLGPTVWPWYLVWGIMVLAPVADRRIRRVIFAVGGIASLLGAAPNKTIWLTLVHANALEDVLVVACVLAAGFLSYRLLLTRPGSVAESDEATDQLWWPHSDRGTGTEDLSGEGAGPASVLGPSDDQPAHQPLEPAGVGHP